MSRSQALQKHYGRVLRLWPQDMLRGVTFHDAMRRRLGNKLAGTPTAASNAKPASSSRTPTSSAPFHEQAEIDQVNALYSLLENRYGQMYKPSDDLLRPKFNPAYYSNLAKEMEEAPTRTWWQKQWLHWSRKVRMR